VRRRSAIDTVSETTSQRNDFVRGRGTGLPPASDLPGHAGTGSELDEPRRVRARRSIRAGLSKLQHSRQWAEHYKRGRGRLAGPPIPAGLFHEENSSIQDCGRTRASKRASTAPLSLPQDGAGKAGARSRLL
jgi:hypothetical protein